MFACYVEARVIAYFGSDVVIEPANVYEVEVLENTTYFTRGYTPLYDF